MVSFTQWLRLYLADACEIVDSLKAVEIRNRSLKELKSDISVFELLSSTPLAELAAKIASRSGLVTAKKEDA